MAGHLGLRRRLSAGSDGRAAFLPHSWRSFHDIGIAAFAGARFPARSRGVDVMKAYAEVIGDPVAHSRSPFIHNFWLGELGIDAEYRTCRVEAGKRSEEHTSELQSLMRISYAVFCLKKKKKNEKKTQK